MTRRFAKLWTVACLGLTALVAGLVLWAWPATAVAPVPDGDGATGGAEPPGNVAVASVVGEVEVRSPGGTWQPLKPGRSLSKGDEVRTAAFSEGVLRAPDGSTIAVNANTTFIIGERDDDSSSFTLGAGRVAADIRREPKRLYEFEAATGEAKADTQGGQFALVSDDDGLLGVVTRKGKVGLTAKGRRVEVKAGTQAVALPGAAPGDPLPIPQEVFLQVRWPEESAGATKVAVAGVTDTGTRVRVAGQMVAVATDGSFETEVPLREGENRIVVVAQDLAGNSKRQEGPVLVRKEKRPERMRLKVQTEGSIWE